jgi:hypothetical protein
MNSRITIAAKFEFKQLLLKAAYCLEGRRWMFLK